MRERLGFGAFFYCGSHYLHRSLQGHAQDLTVGQVSVCGGRIGYVWGFGGLVDGVADVGRMFRGIFGGGIDRSLWLCYTTFSGASAVRFGRVFKGICI